MLLIMHVHPLTSFMWRASSKRASSAAMRAAASSLLLRSSTSRRVTFFSARCFSRAVSCSEQRLAGAVEYNVCGYSFLRR